MSTKEHKKHSEITRPSYGFYARNEWAIVGTHCDVTRSLADDIFKDLSSGYKCGYADARHAESKKTIPAENAESSGAIAKYIDNIQYHEFSYSKAFNQYQFRQAFNDIDILIVNGNHFQAKYQVVVIDKSKSESLKKRLFQLTDVQLFLLADKEDEIFDFIKDALPSWDKIPVFTISETGKITEFFKKNLLEKRPLLNGLVLAGGKSERMGHDKSLISWHGKEQKYYLADLLQSLCGEVYISCRPDQKKEIQSGYTTLEDTFTGLGPYGAILSAFREKPDEAWLIIACDLPLLDFKTVKYLKDGRNPSSLATTFESPYNNLPEPLITIWEPKSYPVLLSFLAQGYTCPGKVLRNNDVTILTTDNPEALTNVNTPEQLDSVRLMLQNKLAADHAT